MSGAAQDRCRGVLLGLVAGDRNGGPSHMAVRLAESLVTRGAFDSLDILNRYRAWWHEGAFDTGPVSGRTLELLAAGLPLQEATAQVHRELGGKTAGCNPAHRSPPLSMFAALADEAIDGCARTEAQLTHYDPLAGVVAAAVNRLCRSLIRGCPWEDALRHCHDYAGQEWLLSDGGYAPEVLRAAIYFVGMATSFAEALERSLVFAGPANYCPVLVGAIGGGRWGAVAIDPPALAHVAILARVREAAEALAAGWTV
jgi:ADP-ribosylglycohydrolase